MVCVLYIIAEKKGKNKREIENPAKPCPQWNKG